MPQGYSLRWFQNDDLDTYIEGLNESLYDRYDRERFQWKFGENPSTLGFNSIVVAVDDESGRPVGFNSFLPLEIRIGEKIVPIVQGCDGYVQKEHRRRGIFLETIKFMDENLSSDGPGHLMGFNFAGSTAAAVKAGSSAVCDINFWEIEPKDFLGQSNHPGTYSLSEIKAEEAHLLYNEWPTIWDQPHIHRSLDYLKWRFEKSPLRDYKFYNLRERNTDLGYVVLSIVENAEGETIVGLDDFILNTTDPSAVIGAMAEMTNVEEDAAKIELLTKKGAALEDSLGRLNIEPDPRYTMIIKPIFGNGSPRRASKVERGELLHGDWHITSSDIY
jgi:hypothetical protein